ncbi:MAG TPA: hypothetical protein PLL06_10505 [Acidobacteriota bacterium]|nr:hypothetical protein [Acidobacteriota bacterium]
MKLATLKDQKAVHVTYEYGGETLFLQVDTNLLTQDFLESMQSLAGVEENGDTLSTAVAQARFMSETLARAIIGWDLVDEVGQRVPIETETFRSLPAVVVSGLFAAVMGAGGPKAETGQPFAGGSFQAAN